MENCRDIDEKYYVGQNSRGSTWIIMYAPPGKYEWVAGYYSFKSGRLTWTDKMPNDDKEFIEKWVRESLTFQ